MSRQVGPWTYLSGHQIYLILGWTFLKVVQWLLAQYSLVVWILPHIGRFFSMVAVFHRALSYIQVGTTRALKIHPRTYLRTKNFEKNNRQPFSRCYLLLSYLIDNNIKLLCFWTFVHINNGIHKFKNFRNSKSEVTKGTRLCDSAHAAYKDASFFRTSDILKLMEWIPLCLVDPYLAS